MPPAPKTPASPESLHIAVVQRIVGKHHNQLRMPLKTVRFVAGALRDQAEAGKGVVLISSELDELLEISDRIGVMYNGELVAVMPKAAADPEMLGHLMLGGSARDQKVPA